MYRRIIETTSEGVWVIDAESRTTFVNASMSRMLGYAPEEMVGRSMFDFMDDEARHMAARNVERRKAGIAEAHDFVFVGKHGERVWTRLTTDPIHGSDGSYQGALGLVVDVTAERANADERDHLWSILDRSLNEIYILRQSDWGFEYANTGALHNLGYGLEALRQMTLLDVEPGHTRESFAKLVEPLVNGRREKLVFETQHRRADGTAYPVEVHLQLTEYRRSRAFVAIVNDVTERQEVEAALRQREARFRALIERNLDLILLIGEKEQFTFASPSASTILGYSPEELLRLSPPSLVHPDDKRATEAALANALASPGNSGRVVFRVRHRDGAYRVLDANVCNLLDDPAVSALVVNARDVTERMRLEEQLAQAQKLESLGRLAGGIAHDFNNILTAILGHAAMFEEQPGLGPEALEEVREIQRAAERAAELTGQLLAIARKRVISPCSVSLNELVARAERFLRRVLGEHVQLSTKLAEGLWPIDVDPSQMDQVILNLAVNARDAMPAGGRLSIEASNVVLDHGSAARRGDVRAGEHVVLAVRDTGQGIPKEVLPHIFEPFFTTKRAGEGTGLGLATVYGIVRQSGGQIWVDSEVGVGTTVTLCFPRSARHGGAPSLTPPAHVATAGRERILIVEDEDAVRKLLVRILTGAGYTVHAAARAEEAVQLTRSHAFALLVTDVVMPSGSGKALAQRLTAEFPELRVLYVSGYAENAIVHDGVLEGGVEFLAKPFAPAKLLLRVREILDGKAG